MVILIRRGMRPGAAIAIALGVSLTCGVINGVSVAFLRINPIITTLGNEMILPGDRLQAHGGEGAMGVSGGFFTAIGSGRILGIPVSVYIMVGVFLLVHVFLTYTAHGKRVYAVGGNAEAAYISGINVKMVRFWGLVVSAAMAALAGLDLRGPGGRHGAHRRRGGSHGRGHRGHPRRDQPLGRQGTHRRHADRRAHPCHSPATAWCS